MRIPNITRHVYPGERVELENTDSSKWSVYVKTDEDAYSTRLGTYDPETSAWTVASNLGSLANAAAAIAQENGNAVFDDSALELLRTAGYSNRATQVISYHANGSASQVYTLDFGDAGVTDLEASIAADIEYLDVLVKARSDAADTKGIQSLTLPDGRTEVYRGVAALDGQIATVRDRIARERAFQQGARFVGGYVN